MTENRYYGNQDMGRNQYFVIEPNPNQKIFIEPVPDRTRSGKLQLNPKNEILKVQFVINFTNKLSL